VNYWLSGWLANGAMQLSISVFFGVVPAYSIIVVLCFLLASYWFTEREIKK